MQKVRKIYIEHLRLDSNRNADFSITKKSTLCDMILNKPVLPEVTYRVQHNFDTTSLVRDFYSKDFEIGALYGTNGITLDQVVNTDKHILLEFPVLWLSELSRDQFIALTNKTTLILTDFEDGGLFSSRMRDYFLRIRHRPVNSIIYLTSSTGLKDLPDFNLKHVHIPYWLIQQIVSTSDRYTRNVDSKITEISATPRSIFLNFKARLYRVICLLKLHQRNLLGHLEWTLVNRVLEFDSDNNIVCLPGKPAIFEQTYNMLDETHRVLLSDFLNTYSLPRMLEQPSTPMTQADLTGSQDNQFSVYGHSIAVETAYGESFIPKSMGRPEFLTEKTYKAFSQASMPLVLCAGEPYRYLTEKGFRVDYIELDSINNVDDRATAFVNQIEKNIQQNIVPCTDKLIHNFKLINDIDFAKKLLADTLHDLKQAL